MAGSAGREFQVATLSSSARGVERGFKVRFSARGPEQAGWSSVLPPVLQFAVVKRESIAPPLQRVAFRLTDLAGEFEPWLTFVRSSSSRCGCMQLPGGASVITTGVVGSELACELVGGGGATTATPVPDTPPPVRLLDLPRELLVRSLSRCDPADIARVAAVSLLFHASLAEEGIRLRAQERGFELPAQPEGESCTVRWLCFAALLCESNPPARVAAAYTHSVFIDDEGRLSSCGSALPYVPGPGLLGHGEGVTRLNTPTRLPSTLGERAVSVSAGDAQLPYVPGGHSLALTADGAVWSWGDGSGGQLGHGDQQHRWQPEKIEALAGQRVVAVSAGGVHSLALAADGSVWSWGEGEFGRLGHGDQQSQLLPQKVEAFAGQRVLSVSAGGAHSIAITADGAVWSWGGGGDGRLGHGDQQRRLLPKKVEALASRRVVAVSAGDLHSLALTADGAVWSWGEGIGRLGHGDQQRQLLTKKVEAIAGRRVVAVSAGMAHSLAVTTDGAVWSWGAGSFGMLGHGDQRTQLLPKKVEAFAGQRVVAVSAGSTHSLAIAADGAVVAWGKGDDGRLGHGEDRSNQLLPKKIEAWATGQ